MRVQLGVAAIGLACGCDAPSVIAPELAERAIHVGLADKGFDAKVTCPPGHPARAGETFTCTALATAGRSATVDVTVQDESGHVTWALRGVIVHEKLMGDGVAAASHGAFRVSCPETVAVLDIGSAFTCDAEAAGSAQHVAITIVDAQGNETAKLIP